MSTDPNMTPEQVLDASTAAVSGAIAHSPKEVERGVQLAGLILGQIRWRGYDEWGGQQTGEVCLNGRKTAIFRPAEPMIHRASGLRRHPRLNWMAAQAQTGAPYPLPSRASGNVRSNLFWPVEV